MGLMLRWTMDCGCSGVERVRQRIASARAVCVLTGAGVSADSGVPTFRGASGLWEGYRVEDVATHDAFARDPAFVWRFYDERRQQLMSLRPNAAHLALVVLEQHCSDLTIATQNIDDLHHLAGSRRVLELHGNIWKARCTRCGAVADYREVPVKFPPACVRCGGMLRPHVVWFGESLDEVIIDATVEALSCCDVLLVIGTSGTVYPVAGFPAVARERGAFLVEVNPQRTPISGLADVVLLGRANEVVPQMISGGG